MAVQSRLQRLEDKRNMRKAVGLIVGAVVLVVIIVAVGVPAVVRMLVWIGDNKAESVAGSDKSDIIPPSPPRLFSQYDATNSAVLKITGLTEAKAKIFLTQNSDSRGNQTADEAGNFVFDNMVLNEGDNKFVAIAVDGAGNQSQQSKVLTIYYKNKEPKLEINSPTENQEFVGKNIKIAVSGKTDAGNKLTINDMIVMVSSEGAFYKELTPQEGENIWRITSTDRAGNTIGKEIKFMYRKY